MKKWPGIGDRILEGLRRLGYASERGKLGVDVMRFSAEHGYTITYLYRWLGGTATPDRDNLFRLARDLKVEPAWLLFGDEKPPKIKRRFPHPIAGGSGDLLDDCRALAADVLPLIRHCPRDHRGARRVRADQGLAGV
jgi:transcriptional regulator with XRE-family HTH domain